MIVESPIINSDFSPPNFKSCGISPITAPLKILQSFPMVVYDLIWAWASIHVLSPIITFSSIIVNGPTQTFYPRFAEESIIAAIE